jgi:hypothetical protein
MFFLSPIPFRLNLFITLILLLLLLTTTRSLHSRVTGDDFVKKAAKNVALPLFYQNQYLTVYIKRAAPKNAPFCKFKKMLEITNRP